MLEQSPPAATLVLLIRHGENEWTASGKLAGRTPGVSLNEKGQAQAAQLAQFLAKQPLAALYSSPLDRCLETAQPLASVLGLPVTVEEGVVEVDYGAWRGAELKELVKLPEWQDVQHFPATFRFPQGETLRQTQQRAVDAVERLVEAHPNQTFAVFSHGDVIRTLLAHYAGVPLDLFQRIQISTASVSVLGFFGGRPAVLTMNMTAELPVYEIKPPKAAAEESQPDNPPPN
ncbi:MAG: MSMEG_4193 family putative phosphomutase [Caldilineaceae bacterium]